MAKKVNPLTGQLEDDGIPEDPNVPPAAIDTAEPVAAAGGGGAPPPMIAADPRAAMRAASPGAKPADVMAAAPATSLESQQVMTKSPTSVGKVETKALKEAAAAADDAAGRERQASVDKMLADQELEAKAIEADKAKQVAEWENAQKEARQREALETDRKRREDEALKAEDEAEKKVRAAQDASINWDNRSVPFQILGAFLRAGSTRDSLIMGRDPNESPVMKALDASLQKEKDRKEAEFKKSKEWRDALKTKNAETINREYARGKAKIDMEVNAQARALLESDKTTALAMRMSKNDQTGKTFQANRDMALAKLDAERAANKMKYADNLAPTVTSGGTTTTNTFIGQGAKEKALPQASVDDAEKVLKLEQIVKERLELAEKLEKADDKDWKELQDADNLQQKEEGFKSVPVLGGAFIGAVRAAGSSDALGAVDNALGKTPGGVSVEDKLRYNPKSQELWRGMSRVVTQEAKSLGGAVTQSDLDAKRAELGVQGQSAKQMAETLRKQAEDFKRQAETMRRQRTFK
jgi:hypothetical protein